ncbi:uncharacterized protein [Haliotis cracherodii]|uniref:uncharacterized protein n=1 Tax=Haliotis cracherodii TaxID=6455 RepID=UPI0039ED95A2
MAKFAAIVAVVGLMIVLADAKESESADHRAAAAAEVSRQARSVSDVIARAMKRSGKDSEKCADFGDECGYWSTQCCESKGLECQYDNDDWFSKGTCWMKF